MRRWLVVIGIVVSCLVVGAGVVMAQSDDAPTGADPPAHRVVDPEDRAAIRECVGQHLVDGEPGRVRALARQCADELGIDLPRRPRWCRRQH